MKMSKRDIGVLSAVLGLLVLFFVYQYVYKVNVDKMQKAEKRLQALQVTEKNLVTLSENMQHYKSEIEKFDDENSKIVARFPANILPEDEIMYASVLEDNTKVYFSSINYGTGSPIETGLEANTGITAYKLPMTVSYQATYQGLKDAVKYTLNREDRTVISSVSATFDSSTGELVGTMTLSQYYLTGTDKTYNKPYIPAIKLGTDNIFKSYTKPKK